jgi:predicted hydrolase (HD superfamily)
MTLQNVRWHKTAGANREIIEKGATMMGGDLDAIIQETINGMKAVASNIGLAG